MATEKITIRLVLDTKGYKSGAQQASRATDQVTQKANKTNTSMGKLSGNLGKVGIAFGAAFAGQKVISGIKNAIDRAEEMNSLYAITATVLEATGMSANVTAEEMRDLAKEQSLLTGIDKALITESNNLLLTFKAVRNEVGEGNDIFTQASGLILDLSVIMGTDAKSGAIQLGKALNDPILGVAALNRVGIQFNETQKEQIKGFQNSGDLMSAQKIILAELEGQFGGTAAAAVDTTDRIGNAFKEASEVIGQEFLLVLDDVAPALIEIAEAVADIGSSAAGILGPLGDAVVLFGKIKDFGEEDDQDTFLGRVGSDLSQFVTGSLPGQVEQFIGLLGRLKDQSDPDTLFAGGRQGATRRFLFGGLFDDLEALDAELAEERTLEIFGPPLPTTELDDFIQSLIDGRPPLRNFGSGVREVGEVFGATRGPIQNFVGDVKTVEDAFGSTRTPIQNFNRGVKEAETTVNKTKFKTKTFSDLRREANEVAASLRILRLRMLEAADPAFAAISAVERAEEAQTNRDKVIADGTSTVRDRAEAEIALAEANIEAQSSLTSLGDGNLTAGIKLIADALDKSFLEAQELLVILGILDASSFNPKVIIDISTKSNLPPINELRDAKAAAAARAAASEAAFFVTDPVGRRVHGGPVTTGEAFLVGERGPEMFIPNQTGRIASNTETQKMAGGGGGMNLTIVNPEHRQDDIVDGVEEAAILNNLELFAEATSGA